MSGIFSSNRAEVGKSGEKLIADFLKNKGYKLIKKNYRTPFGEADIIVEKGEFLVFVEVKTRSSEEYGAPGLAVNFKKRERYVKIAEYFLSQNEKYEKYFIRFDVAEVLAGEINYIKNAFDCD